MAAKQYRLEYLPLFWEDLLDSVLYIKDVLQAPEAADRLVQNVEAGIKKHLANPTAAAIYPSTRKRDNPYYWFPIGNHHVFYVVLDDVMEVRRFLYKRRDTDSVL